jgi:glyoxylase-like metal-dependent hydrolase (beta-lactamase superfamily II)
MAAIVKILIEGYTNADAKAESGGEERTCPTVTLVRDGDLIMVVDPGVLENQQILIDALKSEGLTVNDVNMVCITHSHIDHYRNIGMFPKARVLEYYGVWDRNTVEDWSEQFSINVQVVATPGHNSTDITLFVNTDDGVVAICGDVFWKENYPKDADDDMFASDHKQLEESRHLVLEKADWIIPGHGGIYKAQKNFTKSKKVISILGKNKRPKVSLFCKTCKRPLTEKDSCVCRPWLCYNCCQCDMDCRTCSCSHRKE